jgi:hypothetical protein
LKKLLILWEYFVDEVNVAVIFVRDRPEVDMGRSGLVAEC